MSKCKPKSFANLLSSFEVSEVVFIHELICFLIVVPGIK